MMTEAVGDPAAAGTTADGDIHTAAQALKIESGATTVGAASAGASLNSLKQGEGWKPNATVVVEPKEVAARSIRADRHAENPEQSLLDALDDYMVLCGGERLAEVRFRLLSPVLESSCCCMIALFDGIHMLSKKNRDGAGKIGCAWCFFKLTRALLLRFAPLSFVSREKSKSTLPSQPSTSCVHPTDANVNVAPHHH